MVKSHEKLSTLVFKSIETKKSKIHTFKIENIEELILTKIPPELPTEGLINHSVIVLLRLDKIRSKIDSILVSYKPKISI
jgi:hypothetical protein